MRKLLLILLMSTCTAAVYAQGMVVNRYFNSATADGTGDVVELLVVTDHLDIRKWFIKDYGNGTATVPSRLDEGGGKIRFNDVPLWKDLRSGTVIVLRKRTATSATLANFTPAYVPDVDASDFIIDVDINDTNYMTDIYPDKAFNVTPHEMVLIRADVDDVPVKATPDTDRLNFLNGANKAVHALAYGDFYNVSTFNAVKSPKAIFSNGPYNTTNYVGNGTIGMVTLTNPNVATYTTPLTKSNPLVSLPSYWEKQSALTSGMPYGIEIYRSLTNYQLNPSSPVRKVKAFAVVIDPKYVDFKPTSSAAKTPEEYVADEPGTVLACINGGFFGGGAAYSMVRYNGANLANNIAAVTRNVYNNQTNSYYPTRAAFGLSPDLKPDVAWVYPQAAVASPAAPAEVYAYSTPSPNDVNLAPQPVPQRATGSPWNTVTAIGGSPMLIKDDVINLTADEELIVIDNNSPRARTAIGYTATGKIILFSVEGNSAVADGFTLEELANYLKDAGCKGAINLDGGGSSVLRVGGQPLISPSDGTERPMPAVVLVKSKN
ncbi:MAG TPA: phosphodiester glycosidase family protein [Pelobium sp.]